MAQRAPIDPDAGVTDLVRQLGDDSKRLLRDELRLARMEGGESVHRAGQGAARLGIAFGVMVIALVAATLFLITVIGEMAGRHYWLGAVITAVFEVSAGLWLVRRGRASLTQAPYAFPETRAGIRVLRGR